MLNLKILTLLAIASLKACRTNALYHEILDVATSSEFDKRQSNATDPNFWCAPLDPQDADQAQTIWEGLQSSAALLVFIC